MRGTILAGTPCIRLPESTGVLPRSACSRALGARTDTRDHDGEMLLNAAAREDNLGVVRALLVSGADVNVRDADEMTPLHLAAAFSGWECEYYSPEMRSAAVLRPLGAAGVAALATTEAVCPCRRF